MNAVDINRVEVNRVRVNMCTVNSFAARKAKVGRRLTPIASYRCYDKTNDDADRNVLTDLTGNGHDIQLYNFEFAESSGYGKYGTNFNDWYVDTSQSDVQRTSTNFIISASVREYLVSSSCRLSSNTTSFTFKFRIVKCDGTNINLRIYNSPVEGNTEEEIVLSDIKVGQVYSYTFEDLPTGYTRRNIYFTVQNAKYLEVELIPDYQGALVSDGVDDYGLCENFPDLSIDKGFTVVAIRKWLNQYPNINSVFLSTRIYNNGVVWGPFTIEKINVSSGVPLSYSIISYEKTNVHNLPIDDKPFVYCTSSKYNNIVLTKGDNNVQYNILNLFCGTNKGQECSSVALYALEIYDRDLTDEEIAKVKARMIAEYEEKTGNKYEEETA